MKIAVIGSGNVATQLGLAFQACGHRIVYVYSRNASHARKLGQKLKAPYGNRLAAVSSIDADLFLIAVKDDAIAYVAQHLNVPDRSIVVHTSGATSLDPLRKFKNRGAIWQIQTIQIRNKVDFRKVPIVLETSNIYTATRLTRLASQVSPLVYRFSSKQRRALHLAASFANNFSNHMFVQAKAVLDQHHLPFSILGPLIRSTAENGITDPRSAQTGPAKRNDRKTMSAHLKLLKDPSVKKLYQLISKSIYKTTQNG